MSDVDRIEELKHTFGARIEIGEKLPNPKDVADRSSYLLKSGGTMIKHKMINGDWYVEKINGSNQVVLEKVE